MQIRAMRTGAGSIAYIFVLSKCAKTAADILSALQIDTDAVFARSVLIGSILFHFPLRFLKEWLDDDAKIPPQKRLPSHTSNRHHFPSHIPDEQPSSAIKRRVLVTTDDASVFAEAQRKYPNYEFIGDSQRAKSAELSSRYTHDALVAVITDVVALSHTDYLVCTFSSQVSRSPYPPHTLT
ncbi:unnamed protein product [Dibothriocephalus latus]|uniref:GT23 domain-containing protein n=1 Tax=Dibothriocephalus latus TaxID=60516 RepID=A0A3P7MRI5_DIBLA|nr:unnamed protein product [Dibothriocephalus latus]